MKQILLDKIKNLDIVQKQKYLAGAYLAKMIPKEYKIQWKDSNWQLHQLQIGYHIHLGKITQWKYIEGSYYANYSN